MSTPTPTDDTAAAAAQARGDEQRTATGARRADAGNAGAGAGAGAPVVAGRLRVPAVLRAIYLVVIAVGVFVVPSFLAVAVVAGAQAVFWIALGLGPRRLARQLRKLRLFAVFLLLSYALLPGGATDRWRTVEFYGWFSVSMNLAGLRLGAVMLLRLVAVVLASQVARAGDPRAIARGLRGIGVPRTAAQTIDTVLALFDASERGKGRGRGGGGGAKRRKAADGSPSDSGTPAAMPDGAPEGFWPALKRLARGDVSPIVGRLAQQIARATEHLGVAELEPKARARARDLAVIAGVALTMLGIKALKVLPAIPFAPGHKGVILIPLYVVAARLTRARLGATLTGLTLGVVAFLMGDGRYGVFEIVKHIAPGVLCDLLLPIFVRGNRERGAIFWTAFGAVVALGRFATIFLIVLVVQPPALAWAMLVPGLIVHTTFGALSGLVTGPIVRGVDAWRLTPGAPGAPERLTDGEAPPGKEVA